MTTTSGRPRSAFRWFWAAAAVSNLGDGVRLAAFPLLARQLTGDARVIAGVTAMSFLPWLLVGPVAGVLVDRRNRRTLMVAAQLLRAVALAGLAVALGPDRASIEAVYAVALVVASAETVVDSASQAAIPHLVDDDHLDGANGRMTVAENAFNHVVGVALGAYLFALSPSVAVATAAATFLGGAALLSGARLPFQADRAGRVVEGGATVRADIADGLRFLLQHPFLRPLAFSVAATNLAVNMGAGVMVVLVLDEIQATESAFGTILAVGSLGGVVGAVVAGRLVAALTPRRTLELTHLPFVAAGVLFVVATEPWMVSLAFGLTSVAVVVFQIPSRSMRQRVTPDHLLGRVVAAFRLFGLGGPVVGAPIGGVITRAFGVRSAFAAAIVVFLVAWALARQGARHLRP